MRHIKGASGCHALCAVTVTETAAVFLCAAIDSPVTSNSLFEKKIRNFIIFYAKVIGNITNF